MPPAQSLKSSKPSSKHAHLKKSQDRSNTSSSNVKKGARREKSQPASTQGDEATVLAAENIALRRQLKKLQQRDKENRREEIEVPVYQRPPGEAGSLKRGFQLCDAMGLSDDKAAYNDILTLVKNCCKEVRLDLSQHYRKIDNVKLAKIIRLARDRNEYLASGRFPSDWSIGDIVKQYLRGQRKKAANRGKETKTRFKRKTRALSVDGDDDGSVSGDGGEEDFAFNDARSDGYIYDGAEEGTGEGGDEIDDDEGSEPEDAERAAKRRRTTK